MADVFSETSRENYFSRIGGAIKGVIFGAILFVASFPLLWFNEGHAIHTAKMLKEGAASVVSIDSPDPTSPNEGKLVHFTGTAVGGKLSDDLFGLTQDAIHLQRVVQMYQWKETERSESQKDSIGGGQSTTKTYTYNKVWSDQLNKSSNFRHPQDHENPTSMRLDGKTQTAPEVKVGGFKLDSILVEKIDNYTPIPLNADNTAKLPDGIRSDAVLADGKCLLSGKGGVQPNPAAPMIGDLKISEQAVMSGTVSVIGRQTGALVDAYPTKVGKPLALLYLGAGSADEMFKSVESKNATMTWILRLVGFVIMWIGLMLILNPLKVLADVIGILGDLVGMGLGLATLLLSLGLSVLAIATAWLAYRPIVGGPLLVGGVAVLVWVKKMSHGRRAAR